MGESGGAGEGVGEGEVGVGCRPGAGNERGRSRWGRPLSSPGVRAQLAPPAGAAFSATLEKVLLALLPRVVMAAMHTTMMRASMTAYSTAVGPSSFFRNSTNFLVRLRISVSGSGSCVIG